MLPQLSTPLNYYLQLFNHASMLCADDVPPVGQNTHTSVLLPVIRLIHKASRSAINTLVESIDILTEDIVSLKAEAPRPEIPTPIPFKETENKLLEVNPVPRPPPPTVHLAPPAPAPISSTVVKKGRKKTNNDPKITGSSATVRPLQRKAPTTRKRHSLSREKAHRCPCQNWNSAIR